ncbi:hypothetical protein [Tenacibaculum agarivorans]|uniref:hypothetical protein n=1 Tax=Tenacibaculum agarivorans TaxID=1908389 RepID=UPI00094B97B9|nr:hypothetical protein [Tenacibaculum agarivorans]
MNKSLNLIITGLLISLVGVVIFLAKSIGIEISKVLIPILLIFSGGFAISFSKANSQNNKVKQYHLLQGVGFIAFALASFFSKNLENFLYIICFFTLFHGLLEFLLGFTTLNNKNINWNIIIYRFLAGIVNLIIAFTLLIFTFSDKFQAIILAGVSILLSGISIIIFSLKSKQIINENQ